MTLQEGSARPRPCVIRYCMPCGTGPVQESGWILSRRCLSFNHNGVLIIHKSNAGNKFGRYHQLCEWFAATPRPGQPRRDQADAY